tara:strand:- start:36 stop:974 length:939 start_codon:yes stop_codon:yes gene_type:complete
MLENNANIGNSNLGDTDVIEQQSDSVIQNDSDVNEFFNSLDKEVNDIVYENVNNVTEQATQQAQADPNLETQRQEQQVGSDDNTVQSNGNTDWKKRYQDSSREAQKLNEQYKQVEPFIPILDTMKNDSGLVDHVRDYLENGGEPAKSVQEQLGLDEDFIYDEQEAMTNPESDSAKVREAQTGAIVNKRIQQVLDNEREVANRARANQAKKEEASRFMAKHNMSQEKFDSMVSQAKQHTLSLEDINYVLNRDQNATNVRNSTQNEMLSQMKNVRNMPTSQSNQNSTGETKTSEEQMFDSVFGTDSNDSSGLFG